MLTVDVVAIHFPSRSNLQITSNNNWPRTGGTDLNKVDVVESFLNYVKCKRMGCLG